MAALEAFASLGNRLAAVGRSVVARGLVVASGGNLSARQGDAIVVTAAGAWLDEPEFSVVGLAGDRRAGPPPSSELPLHLAAYRARGDVQAVLHLHPQTALLLDALNQDVHLLTTDHAYYLRRVRRTPYATPGSAELARTTAEALRGCDCVVLARHGCCVVADSVDLAHRRALNLEEAARMTYRALLLGRVPADCPRPEAV